MEKQSRYRGSSPVADRFGSSWIPERPRAIRKDYPDNVIHTAIEGEDCTLLARAYLEDERFWWVVADWNDVFNALETFRGGEQVVIPSIRTLYGEIIPQVIG